MCWKWIRDEFWLHKHFCSSKLTDLGFWLRPSVSPISYYVIQLYAKDLKFIRDSGLNFGLVWSLPLGVIWDHFGGTLVVTFRVLWGHIQGTQVVLWGYLGGTLGIKLGILWGLFGGNLGIKLVVPLGHLGGIQTVTFWSPWALGGTLGSYRGYFSGTLGSVWGYSGNPLGVPWGHFGGTLRGTFGLLFRQLGGTRDTC